MKHSYVHVVQMKWKKSKQKRKLKWPSLALYMGMVIRSLIYLCVVDTGVEAGWRMYSGGCRLWLGRFKFESQFHILCWPWGSHLTSLRLCVLSGKIEIKNKGPDLYFLKSNEVCKSKHSLEVLFRIVK